MTHSAHTLPWWQQRAVTITMALLGLLVVLVAMNINIAKYETHLATGDTVLLELAPVDPRGFMQGDYMALSYALEREVFAALEQNPNSYPTNEGYLIVKIDNNKVGHFVRLADNNNRDNLNNLATNEMPIHYRIRNGSVLLATNAFFFQEGHAKAFEAAKYGLFRVNKQGEPLLTDMVNDKFEVIHPEPLSAAQNVNPSN
ncbi:GDYXXLXY domain-containing protein [Psychrobacter urativorans]|uniref:GDYXXLXY protein n=1 Tax=Psychrobacter urativorans TaxID=45610 RepID=A0A0M4T2E1_9GAMM|nr:GDYXXLXY domain-containing protein [Psychrobacter urativorans]ALF59728.1 hypothetical protein AOC03_06515 [Psychrobacter urativorans]